jgi:hypothetical protein
VCCFSCLITFRHVLVMERGFRGFLRLCDGDASMLLQGRLGDSNEWKING